MGKRSDKALEKLASGYGGMEHFHSEREEMSKEASKAWDSDIVEIGRVLRAHLYVEYYLNKYLKSRYSFKAKELVNISFFEKIKLIKNKNDEMKPLISSIKRFNHIRNTMSHNLNSTITAKDAKYFESRKEFNSYYFIASASIDDIQPVDIYELYSQFIVHRIYEILNPKQHLLDDVMKAISKDAADIYFERA